MKCKICEKESNLLFTSKVLGKYDVKYFHCGNCGFIFTEYPYWIEESYSSAINLSDTGIMDRNIHYSRLTSVLLFFFFDKRAKFLDYGGGYGIFTRLMRDVGFDFYWEDKFCGNILAKGFKFDSLNPVKVSVVTAFEVFEHLVNPKEEIDKLLSLSDTIIFSTELLPVEKPKPEDWWYYSFDHGQHVAFYSSKTLNFIADKYQLKVFSFGNFHVLTKNKINLFLARFLLNLSKFGIFLFVKKSMKSLIWDDHIKLKTKSK
ncbi:MAG: class I SAM-dependent methyltransferase [Ignavibacteriaceae bacterium]